MKINNIQNLKQITKTTTDKINNTEPQYNNIERNTELKLSGHQIPFCAMMGISTVTQKLNGEINKLCKQVSEMLSSETELTQEEYIQLVRRKKVEFMKSFMQRAKAIMDEMTSLERNEENLPQQMQESLRRKLLDRALALKSEKAKLPKKPTQKDDRLDFALLHRLKTAIDKGDLGLKKVYNEYYKDLHSIKTIEELSEKYPKIIIPQRPEDVIAQKLSKNVERDFYTQFLKLSDSGDIEASSELTLNKTLEVISTIDQNLLSKNPKAAQRLIENVATKLSKILVTNAYEAKRTGTLSKFPVIPSNRSINKVTQTDIQLLNIDNFDDFVISTVKQHYLDGTNLSKITYPTENGEIKINFIKTQGYNFGKNPEKIKSIITNAEKLLEKQLDYSNATPEVLRARLEKHATEDFAENEELYERIFEFSTCKFLPEDITQLKLFLKELDDVRYGKKTTEEALDTIAKNDIRPRETDNFNKAETLKAQEELKLAKEKTNQLNKLTYEFDEAINTLYRNGLTVVANSCSTYKPATLNPKEIENAEFIIKTVQSAVDNNTGKLLSKERLESKIERWDRYNFYKECDPDNPTFKKALEYSQKETGDIDIDHVGRYLINNELIKEFPGSLEDFDYPEILKIIKEKAVTDEIAVNYLCKFDNYRDLDDVNKTKIDKIIELFDGKDPVEKLVSKFIVEKFYINSDTISYPKINAKGKDVIKAGLCAEAKQQILNKYNFPRCIEFFSCFEDALTRFGAARNSSGIKQIGANNEALKKLYKMEVKIMGHDDRLLSSNNDYMFDIFDPTGLH